MLKNAHQDVQRKNPAIPIAPFPQLLQEQSDEKN